MSGGSTDDALDGCLCSESKKERSDLQIREAVRTSAASICLSLRALTIAEAEAEEAETVLHA